MRISDWSSDVCSSDLIPSLPIQLRLQLSTESRGRHEPHRFLAQRGCVVRHYYSPVAQIVMTSWAASQVSSMSNIMRAGTLAQFAPNWRSEDHTSELQSLMRTSYAVFCWINKLRMHRHNSLKRRPKAYANALEPVNIRHTTN